MDRGEQEESQEAPVDEDIKQLILTVANEMPVTYEKEALKAQAVIARTNLVYARENDQAEPEMLSSEDMREQLGMEEYQKRYEILKSCIEETTGEIVRYEGQVVQLPYHFTSAGMTRDEPEMDEDHSMPYLKAVPSLGDFKSQRFLKIGFFSKKQFKKKLEAAYPDLEFPEETDQIAKVKKRDSASYVLVVELPGQKISGEEFRNVFSLDSSCFSIKEVDGQVRIVTKGYGQGYGMSQFGANEMAKEGSTYREILEYYYTGITIGTVEE